MFKSALAALFSLLVAVSVAPNAVAAGTQKGTVAKSKQKKGVVYERRASVQPRDRIKRRVAFSGRKHRAKVQRATYRPAPARPSAADLAGLGRTTDLLSLKSSVAYVIDPATSQVLFEKNANVALPIASITKLMTALIVVEANQDLNEVLEVTDGDVDREKNTSSRLRLGARLTRANMLHIALMSSENRAASALGRHYPGGLPAFVAAMNAKARELGMNDTHFVDSTGLSSRNVASARDLVKLIVEAQRHPLLCQYSTDTRYMVDTGSHALEYKNSNHLVNNPAWEIMLQKTGYIVEAGRCLVMQAKIEGRAVIMVLLDSKTKESRLADAGRVRKWIETVKFDKLTNAAPAPQS
jgi:D-alanyl-D-alanine endopeptidase (penicillin-binding protein 7)